VNLEKVKSIATGISSEHVDLGVAAGVIPESPADAYRLGYQQGLAATQATGDSLCWFCRHPRQKPALDDQIKQLAALHYERTIIFHWAPQEFEALRQFLEEGDVLAAILTGRPYYGTVQIIRNRKMIDIPRKTLQERTRDED
jgi:hypothetical protein